MKLSLALMTSLGVSAITLHASAQSSTSSTSTSTSTPASTSTTSTTTQATTPAPVTGEIQPATSTVDQTTTEQQATTETKSPINRPLLLTGFVLLGGTYAASAIDAAESGRYADHHYLYYPVVGPWMDLANRNCNSMRPCGGETGNKALLILDGVGQGLGALMMVTSLFIPEKSTHSWILLGNNDVQAGPTLVGTGYGLGAAGRF